MNSWTPPNFQKTKMPSVLPTGRFTGRPKVPSVLSVGSPEAKLNIPSVLPGRQGSTTNPTTKMRDLIFAKKIKPY